MRKSLSLLFGAMTALAMGSLTGCSDDLTVEQEKVDHDQERYLSVSIMSPSGAGTRAGAGDFFDGTPEENAVADMYFVFYDAKGIPTGETTHIESPTFNADTERPSVNSIYSSVVPIQLKQGDNLPSYVMCYINPINVADLANATLADIEGITRKAVTVTKIGKEGTNYFPMSNSVYYGTDPITGEKDKRMIATPISTEQIYASRTDAEAALADKKTTDIYVERYASRIQLTLAPGAISEVKVATADDENPVVAVNGYTLKFIPKAWRPNAIDQKLYAIKRYGLIDEGNVPNFNPDFAQINEKLTWEWNDAANFRSYWACSPSYYDNDYPQVSDDITDVVANNAHGNTYPYKLHYFNYNQIVHNTTGNTDTEFAFWPSIEWDGDNATNGFSGIFYARETTTAVNAWTGANKLYNPLASLASAVIVGHYQLTAVGGSTAVPTTPVGTYPTFYLYGKTGGNWNLYFEDAITDEMIKNQTIVFVRNGDNTYTPATTKALFTVEHPSADVRKEAGATVAGRLVALQLKAVPETAHYFYNTATSQYEQIATGNIDKVNANLLTAGYARKYGNGLCYYNIPIEHLGIYATASGDQGTYITGAKNADGTYNFEKCPAGSFGIVRNHAYHINIKSIKGLATALSSETQPIVPPMNEKEYYMAARVNILNWRIVPTQNVTL